MIDTHIVPGLITVGSVTSAIVVAALDPTLIAGAAVLVIAALAGGVVQIINAVSAARERRAAAEAAMAALLEASKKSAEKNEEILQKTAKIEHTTNGTNTHLQTAVSVLNERIAGMERVMAQMEEEKKTTAAMRVATDLQKADAKVPGDSDDLKKIEVNTDETARNTAKTQSDVETLTAETKTTKP